MRKAKEAYTKNDVVRAEERGKRIGMIQGIEDFEKRLEIDLKDTPETEKIVHETALKLKRSIERRSLLK